MIVKTDYGIMFIRPENPADDKTAIAIGRGLRQWYSSLSSVESPGEQLSLFQRESDDERAE